jgi:hypothetical protein
MGIVALVPRPGTSKPAPGHKIYPYLLRGVAITLPSPAGRLASIKKNASNGSACDISRKRKISPSPLRTRDAVCRSGFTRLGVRVIQPVPLSSPEFTC